MGRRLEQRNVYFCADRSSGFFIETFSNSCTNQFSSPETHSTVVIVPVIATPHHHHRSSSYSLSHVIQIGYVAAFIMLRLERESMKNRFLSLARECSRLHIIKRRKTSFMTPTRDENGEEVLSLFFYNIMESRTNDVRTRLPFVCDGSPIAVIFQTCTRLFTRTCVK